MALPPAAQVQSNYDPNAATYLPGTQDQGDTPALKPAVQKAPANPTLPVANPGLSTGTLKAPANNPTVPVAGQTSDPLAFATGTFNTTGSPATQGQQANPPAYDAGGSVSPNAANTLGYGDAAPQDAPPSPASGMTTAQWDNYSPLSGLTEQQKAEYWAGQGTTGLAYGATPTGSTGNPSAGGAVSTYNPLQTASNDAALAAAGKTDTAVQGVQPAQAAALTNYNATNTAANDASNLASQNALLSAEYNQPGYAAQYGAPPPLPTTYTPPVDSPNVTQGFPSNYDPTKPVQPNNGSVDANGNYVLPGTTPTYLPPGSVSSGGTPSTGPASGSPATTGSPATSGTATSSSPTSGATLTGPVSTAGPINSQPTLTPLTPDNALTNSIISPNSNVDRFAVAKQQIQDEINNELNPQFDASTRQIAAQSFGAGRGVSGANRTAEGNLALQHGRDINQLTSSYLNPALTGTIQDTLNNANFAAGQQNFEAGQQQTGFNQATTIQQLQDAENQQQFSQALQKLIVGSQGDPAQLQLLLSELYGGQSAQSSQAAQNLAKSAVG